MGIVHLIFFATLATGALAPVITVRWSIDDHGAVFFNGRPYTSNTCEFGNPSNTNPNILTNLGIMKLTTFPADVVLNGKNVFMLKGTDLCGAAMSTAQIFVDGVYYGSSKDGYWFGSATEPQPPYFTKNLIPQSQMTSCGMSYGFFPGEVGLWVLNCGIGVCNTGVTMDAWFLYVIDITKTSQQAFEDTIRTGALSWSSSMPIVRSPPSAVAFSPTMTLKRLVMTTQMINVTDADNSPSELYYQIISSDWPGRFRFQATSNSISNVVVGNSDPALQFTQQILRNNSVWFEANTVAFPSLYTLTYRVCDISMTCSPSATLALNITYSNNIQPIITTTPGRISKDAMFLTIDTSLLLVMDTDTPPEAIRIQFERPSSNDRGFLSSIELSSDTYTVTYLDILARKPLYNPGPAFDFQSGSVRLNFNITDLYSGEMQTAFLLINVDQRTFVETKQTATQTLSLLAPKEVSSISLKNGQTEAVSADKSSPSNWLSKNMLIIYGASIGGFLLVSVFVVTLLRRRRASRLQQLKASTTTTTQPTFSSMNPSMVNYTQTYQPMGGVSNNYLMENPMVQQVNQFYATTPQNPIYNTAAMGVMYSTTPYAYPQ